MKSDKIKEKLRRLRPRDSSLALESCSKRNQKRIRERCLKRSLMLLEKETLAKKSQQKSIFQLHYQIINILEDLAQRKKAIKRIMAKISEKTDSLESKMSKAYKRHQSERRICKPKLFRNKSSQNKKNTSQFYKPAKKKSLYKGRRVSQKKSKRKGKRPSIEIIVRSDKAGPKKYVSLRPNQKKTFNLDDSGGLKHLKK
ncbi:unnamed protein product [Moneuplotes crassus]|uniref:Uncharacterized protein n=1 Tax=Euplotes crassus TaxID=5936 RepID=A0AAD1UKT0_EUPCR|nr:unnamed protein product [Moneuplotes crassus]